MPGMCNRADIHRDADGDQGLPHPESIFGHKEVLPRQMICYFPCSFFSDRGREGAASLEA